MHTDRRGTNVLLRGRRGNLQQRTPKYPKSSRRRLAIFPAAAASPGRQRIITAGGRRLRRGVGRGPAGAERNGAERGGGPARPRLRRPPQGCGAPRSPRSSSAERGPEGRCRSIGGSPRRGRSRRRRGGRWGAGEGCWRWVPKFAALRRSAFPRCSVQPGGSRARLLGPPRPQAVRGDPGPLNRPSGPEPCPLVSSPCSYVRVYVNSRALAAAE